MGEYDLAYKRITELPTATGVPAAGDFTLRYDASLKAPVKVAAEVIELTTTTDTLTAAQSGMTIILNSATAFVTTLPALAAGLSYKFYCGANEVTGGNHTIVPTDDNTIHGQVTLAGALLAAADEGSINLIADKFIQGDWIEVFSDGVGWYVSGQVVTAAGVTFTT